MAVVTHICRAEASSEWGLGVVASRQPGVPGLLCLSDCSLCSSAPRPSFRVPQGVESGAGPVTPHDCANGPRWTPPHIGQSACGEGRTDLHQSALQLSAEVVNSASHSGRTAPAPARSGASRPCSQDEIRQGLSTVGTFARVVPPIPRNCRGQSFSPSLRRPTDGSFSLSVVPIRQVGCSDLGLPKSVLVAHLDRRSTAPQHLVRGVGMLEAHSLLARAANGGPHVLRHWQSLAVCPLSLPCSA